MQPEPWRDEEISIWRDVLAEKMRAQAAAPPTGEPMTPLIFLSHSSRDSDLAMQLASEVEERLADLGLAVKVFNTSEAEDRFPDFAPRPGEDWTVGARSYAEGLGSYLIERMLRSSAYLLLVTQASLHANSRPIAFEIEVAHMRGTRAAIPFLPCVARGATLMELPARARDFRGVDLDRPEGVTGLVDVLLRLLRSDRASSAEERAT